MSRRSFNRFGPLALARDDGRVADNGRPRTDVSRSRQTGRTINACQEFEGNGSDEVSEFRNLCDIDHVIVWLAPKVQAVATSQSFSIQQSSAFKSSL